MAEQAQSCFKRYEKKYMLTPTQQLALLQKMQPYMQADRYGKYSICNIYYDTPDWRLVRASIEKPIYKEKLRVRSYGVPGADGTVFAEIKKKYDGVVYKRRITLPVPEVEPLLNGQIPGSQYGQIGREIAWFQQFYHSEPKVYIGYDRLAFAGIQDPELRITFDTNLRWRTTDLDLRCGADGALLLSPEEILMEIKIPGTTPLWLSHALDEIDACPTSFSKYGSCYGRCLLGAVPRPHTKEDTYCA